MKLPRSLAPIVLPAIAFAMSVSAASASQYTYNCTGTGQYDMLSLMFMQSSYLSDNYYLKGTGYSWSASKNAWVANGTVEHNDVPDVITSHGTNGSIWDTGKINSVKDYQGVPNGTYGGAPTPPFWGYPWDINLFDDNYVYLWITENNWGDAYSYKAFNNGSSNNSMLFTRRCVVPGDGGTTSVLVNSPKGTGSNTTEYFTVPSGTPTFTSADCNSKSAAQDLKYAIMTVGTVQPNSYTLYDTLNNNQPISLSIVPVTYQWDCQSASGNCGTQETFEFGFDGSNNNYGLVQWSSYSSPNNNSQYTTPQSLSVFNNLEQWSANNISEGEGGTTVSFPCNPI